MLNESFPADEISFIPITGVRAGGSDFYKHVPIAYDGGQVIGYKYNTGGQGTANYNFSGTQGHIPVLHNLLPKIISFWLRANDKPEFMQTHIEGSAWFWYHYAGEGDRFANEFVLWIANHESCRLIRNIRGKRGFCHGLLTQKTPTVNWRYASHYRIGVETHYLVEGYYDSATGYAHWNCFLYNATPVELAEMICSAVGSFVLQPT